MIEVKCPLCGYDVTPEAEDRDNPIICPECKHDFWYSEAELIERKEL